MNEENEITGRTGDFTPDWTAIQSDAEVRVGKAIEQLSELLTTKNRLDLLGRVATYILFSPGGSAGGQEAAQKSEVNLEYLCSLATALPASFSTNPPSANDVQTTIDLLAAVHMHASVFYTACKRLSKQADEALSDLSTSFQLHKLHVRGDGYWHHIKQTWHDLLAPHDEMFQKTMGFAFANYFNLVDRLEGIMENRINQESDQKIDPYRDLLRPWIGELESGKPLSEACKRFLDEHHDQIEAARISFDEFGSAETFLVEPHSVPEMQILTSLSCSFGDNASFSGGRERFLFWPLNETLTDKKPFIQHQGRYYAFNFAKIGRNAYEFASHALRESNSDYWHSHFLPARDLYLEDETCRLLQKALPASRIVKSAFYPLRIGGRAEADIVVVMDDVLLVVECKAGAITTTAKRGGAKRVKTDVNKTVAAGLNQAERLVSEMVACEQIVIQGKKSDKITLEAVDFRWVFRINVTLDLVSPVSSTIWSLSDLGLVGKTERSWSVSLNDLRVVVEILDRPTVFLHYLIRRFDTNQLRNVEAADELDYMMYYLHQGLFFRGKNSLRANEQLKIIGYTDDLDQYYRRKQGWTEKGRKPRLALGPQTERFLNLLERWRPRGWMTAALQFLEFDRPCREELLGKIHMQLKRTKKKGSEFALSLIGCADSKTAIALVCARNPKESEEIVRARCTARCKDNGFELMVVIVVGMPVAAICPIILCVTPNDSASVHAKRLLSQLRFDVTEHRPQVSRPGIFDGIREDEE